MRGSGTVNKPCGCNFGGEQTMKNRERLKKSRSKRENDGIWRSMLRDNDGIWGTIEKRVFSFVL
jgi:hypothetical protein